MVSALVKSSRSFNGDLRSLPATPPPQQEQVEREEPEVGVGLGPYSPPSLPLGPTAPAPGPDANFAGLDFATWGAGLHPPDTNGDVGPNHYIQTINSSIGIYSKAGAQLAAFSLNTFMSQGAFGNLCDTTNRGDPVVLYDSFEDRWIITDFAFQSSGSNIVNPPGAFECFAVSKTGDPVAGGWNFYSLQFTDYLNDYPKLGIWPDGLYMSANMFSFHNGPFANARVWALNKAQMYAGDPTVQVVSFDASPSEFSLLPSNARLQAGTPPAGTPNYFTTVWNSTNVVSVYKFHVDWNSITTSTFTGPTNVVAPTSWAVPPGTVPSQGGNNLQTLAVRLMAQNQYTNLGGVESLWNSHTVLGSSSTQSAVRYYQLTVTGATVAANTAQAATHNPDTTSRFMPSLAVDRAGNLALGYSTSSGTQFPAIKYAGRLFTDPVDSLPQTETSLIDGTGTQSGNCGPGACTRWGDYSAMSLDPDGCTFWLTNMYYATTGLDHQTRIGSLKYPSCTTVTNGTLQGTVTNAANANPISGATVTFGSRTATTDGSGVYTFSNVPSGTYPTIAAARPGFNPGSAANIVVSDAATTTQNFALNAAPVGACLTDTSQADFQTGVPANCDLTGSPGNVTLSNVPGLDQQNLSVTSSGFGFNSTAWVAQTFTAGITGQLTRADVFLFCSACTGTTPNLTVSVRATSGDLPTGADLATATITGFSTGSGGYFAANFGAPAALTAGTTYALVVRAVSNPSAGTYAYVVSSGSPYAGGRRTTSTNSGASWTGQTTDLGFKTFIQAGFTSGTQLSSLKDANPVVGGTAAWTTLSWNATTPANTTVRFQVAATNNPAGPFNFVGPDNTAATFFTTSGSSLSQFNGLRYLRYKAFLSSTDTAATPTLTDVTVCFSNDLPTAVSVAGFEALRTKQGVAVTWRTGTEATILGFNVFRAGTRVNRGLITAKHAGRALGASYRFVDRARAGVSYRLQVVGVNGRRTWHGVRASG